MTDFLNKKSAKINMNCQALFRLNEEDLRSRRFLNPSSYNKVNQECQKRLVESYLGFLHSECKELIKNEVKHGNYYSFD